MEYKHVKMLDWGHNMHFYWVAVPVIKLVCDLIQKIVPVNFANHPIDTLVTRRMDGRMDLICLYMLVTRRMDGRMDLISTDTLVTRRMDGEIDLISLYTLVTRRVDGRMGLNSIDTLVTRRMAGKIDLISQYTLLTRRMDGRMGLNSIDTLDTRRMDGRIDLISIVHALPLLHELLHCQHKCTKNKRMNWQHKAAFFPHSPWHPWQAPSDDSHKCHNWLINLYWYYRSQYSQSRNWWVSAKDI